MESDSKANKISDLEARPESTLLSTIQEAEDALEKKKGEAAIDLWTRVTAQARICYGARHYYYALGHIKTAQCYLYLQGLHDQSLHHSTEGLGIMDTLPATEKNSPKVLHINSCCLCVLGEIQIYQGHLSMAETNLMKAEKLSGIYSRSPDGEVDTLLDARIALNLGRLCFKQRKLQLAKECMEKALEFLQSSAKRDFTLELTVMNELTDVFVQLNDHQTAIGCLNEADKLSGESFGESSAERAKVFMKMASVYMTVLKRGRDCTDDDVTRAEDCIWDAYGILSTVKGSAHPTTLETQDELIKLLVLTERYKEAVKILKDLIPNKARAYGEGSLEVGKARKVLGSIYLYMGEVGKASQELKQARELFVAVHGPNHRDVIEVSKTLDTLTGSVDGTKVAERLPFKTII